MWGDHDDTNERDALNKVENNDGDITHDMLAGAAAAVAMNEWNQKQERDGKPVSYAAGQTALAGLAVAAATHLIETKGMDQYDSYQAKHDAAEQAKKALSQSGIYGQQDTYETRAYDKDNDDERNNSGGGYGGRSNKKNNDKDNENRNRGALGFKDVNDDDETSGTSGFGRDRDDKDETRGGYNKRDDDNDNDNQTRGEGYGGVGGNNYGSGGAGQYGSGGIGGGRREDGENQFGRNNNNNDNDGENKGYYNKEQGGEGFSGRNKDENEYGSENRRGEGRGDRSNDNERSNDY